MWNSSLIKGFAIKASDGRLGTVSDFLFDDESWLVRWLVVDAGTWLSDRKVLLPPSVLGHVDSENREFSVRLTKQQVKDSPDINAERPVSRQMEGNIYDYYGWNPYWNTGLNMGGYAAGGLGSYGYSPDALSALPSGGSRRSEELEEIAAARRRNDDPHLRSIDVVTGYHIHATDGAIGHVEDFLVEDGDWSIHYLVVDTSNWLAGKKVLISPRSVHDIDWTEKLVDLDVGRQQVNDSPTYDLSTLVDRAYERNFHNYYQNIRPWRSAVHGRDDRAL
jgi:hypothetical protein